MADIILSAGVRQNLLALQNTAQLMSVTQNRLATGKKINTALDNPTNFFTSQALSNRAKDLNGLLDAMGQAQKTLEEADHGITALTKLVEQARSIAKQALQVTQPTINYAAVSVSGTIATPETIGTVTGATFGANAVAGDAGNLIVNVGGTDYTVALGTGDDLDAFVANFNGTAGLGPSGAVTASNVGGQLVLTANNADVDFTIGAGSTAGTLTKLGLTSGATVNSTSLFDITGGGTLTVGVNGGTPTTITIGTGPGQVSTIAELNTALAGLTGVTASATGTTVSFNVAGGTSANSLSIGGSPAVLAQLGLTAGTTDGVGTVASADITRANLQTQYNDLLVQIDGIARDSSYGGINLLFNDDLKIVFSPDGQSSMTIKGVTFNAAGLGLTPLTGNVFQTNVGVEATLSSIDTALSTLRAQATDFGSKLSTVQVRQDFTKSLVNTLQTGADNLVLADTNEEGANMLALQTRQQLSTTALSLASQADQAVLRLFG